MSHDVNSDYARLYLDLGQARWWGDYRKSVGGMENWIFTQFLLSAKWIFLAMKDEIWEVEK